MAPRIGCYTWVPQIRTSECPIVGVALSGKILCCHSIGCKGNVVAGLFLFVALRYESLY